jgi:signal transduction histidine kinase
VICPAHPRQQSSANEWRQIAQAGNLTLHVIIERKGLYILGDERRLRWALGSIVDNAIKYTPPGGALTLEIQEESGEMGRLRVRDNGAGISRDDLPHVFTRFFRGTPVTKSGRVIHVPGMGQGLTIARQIFEAHGGGIRIKSNQNVGTAVYMSLPLTSGEQFDLPYFDEADMDGETMLLDTNIPLDVEIE